MRATGIAALIALLVVATGASIKSSIVNTEGSTAPTDTRLPWTRDRDRQNLVHNDSLGKWLGEKVEIVFDRNATNVTGFLRLGGNGVPSDTTTGQEDGFYEPDTLRLVEIIGNGSSAGAINCSTAVYANQTRLTTLLWTGSKNSWSFEDSSARLLTGEIMSVEIIANGGTPVNPNYPILRFVFREQVSP